MDSLILGEDIHVAYLSTANRPKDISKVRARLNAAFSDINDRRTFCISKTYRPGEIIYKVGVEATPAEAEELNLEIYNIKHGAYMSFYITDFRSDSDRVLQAFELLKGQQEADPEADCIEWFIGDDDVKCLIRSGPEDYPEPHL